MAATEAESWWRPYRQVGDVRVLHVDLSAAGRREETALALLDDTEQRRRTRFLADGPRRRFTLCRAALRSVLGDELACRNDDLGFGFSEHDKPFATVSGRRAPISFNVSHSGKHGLIALAHRGRVGVDVEELVPSRNLEILIGAVLGPNEQAEVTAARGREKLRLFLDLWTMKEALSKAHGMGMSMDVSAFEIPEDIRHGAPGGLCRFSQMPGAAWRLDRIGTDQFAAAVAHEAEG